MNSTAESFQRIAKAEKELGVTLGPEIVEMVRAIEASVGLPINEIRIVGSHDGGGRWVRANCTLLS